SNRYCKMDRPIICSHGALSTCIELGIAPTERGGYSIVAKNRVQFVLAAVLVAIVFFYPASSFAQGRTIKLDEQAFTYAQQLIAQGHVVVDKRNDWNHHHQDPQQENEFIRAHGFDEYSTSHL